MAGPGSIAENDGNLRVFEAAANGSAVFDPIATARLETSIDALRETFIISSSPTRCSRRGRAFPHTAFFHLGNLVEVGDTEQIFTYPVDKRTRDYLTGRFG